MRRQPSPSILARLLPWWIAPFWCIGALTTSSTAADWPGWRGADGSGISPETGLPLEWSAERGVVWSVDLPQWGNSSPCVVGDRVYLTAQLEDASSVVFAVDRGTGRRLWTTPVAEGELKHHELHNMASPTCVADGKNVWALFGTGDLACLDRAGRLVWQRNLTSRHGEYSILWGMASSLRLHGNSLFTICLHGGDSYVLAVDKGTGKDRWRTDRKLECVGEAVDTYSSPALATLRGVPQLIVAGCDHVDAYALDDGEQLWSSGGLKIAHDYGRSIASPTVAGDRVFAVSSGYGGLGRVLALDFEKVDPMGDVTETARAWTYEKHTPDCPTPVVYRGLLWLVRDNGVGSCLDARTGEVKWRERLFKGDCKASLVAGDGKVWFTSKAGETLVLAATAEKKILARNRLEGVFISTPAISEGQIFLRGRRRLWCIGKKPASE